MLIELSVHLLTVLMPASFKPRASHKKGKQSTTKSNTQSYPDSSFGAETLAEADLELTPAQTVLLPQHQISLDY